MGGLVTGSDELILALDYGTQSIRAGLVDLAGNIRNMVKTPIEPYFSQHPGWAEQSPEYYWQMLSNTCRKLFAETEMPGESIKAVALTTQRGTYVNVDKNGNSLRPAIVWLDQRKANIREVLSPSLLPVFKMIRLYDIVEFATQYCRSNWIQQNQPEIWAATFKFLYLSGYLTYKMTGEFLDSVGNIIGTIPFNVKKFDWAGKMDIKRILFPLERDKLPGLVKPTELLGYISDEAAAATGIPRGLPLIAASNDKACEILGAGCLSPETACISYGTIATINTQIDKYVELYPLVPPYPSAVPDQFYTEVQVMRGMWMITWFKEEFGLQERLEAKESKATPEELLEKLIRDIPPGSMGLVLQPYWTPGPDIAPYSKGSIIGFGDIHTRAHLYRSIIEGLVYALKEGTQITEKKNKRPITELRVSGGGSQSDTIVQITADIFDLPVKRSHTHETSTVGAAIDAAVGLGFYPDIPAAVKAMSRPGRNFEPIAANREIYQEIYQRVYQKIYKKLLPLFKEIQEITGYPQ